MCVCKLFALPHINAVLTGRGSYLFHTMVAAVCFALPLDLRSLIGVMPKMLEEQRGSFLDTLERKGLDLSDHLKAAQEVVLVGWSPAEQRMIGRVFLQEDDRFIAKEIENAWIAPWDDSLSRFPNPRTREEMVNLAGAQIRVMIEKAPHAAAGGKFIIAELRRDSMTIAPAYDFGRISRAPEQSRVQILR